MKIGIIFGTRPEAIKLAPLILEFEKSHHEIEVANSGQHKELLAPVLASFNITPDHNFEVMQPGSSLPELMTRLMGATHTWLLKYKPELLLVHGDTTTAMIGAIAAHNMGIKVGHVEAGLRTESLWAPWPEESNRRLIDVVSELYFAPTANAGVQLIEEGKFHESVFVTGNTVIDAIKLVSKRLNSEKDLAKRLDEKIGIERDRPFVLVTQHRRESFGDDLLEIFSAVLEASQKHQEVLFIVPLHKNPNVVEAAQMTIFNQPNVRIIQSLDYFEMVRILQNTILIVTDSGGLQEEAPAMNIPVLITRKVTERPEVVDVGAAKLVGTSREVIFNEINQLLTSKELLESMRNKVNPFGDGTASHQIIRIISDIESNEKVK